ncbi:MAG: hypothetical protein QOK09_405, partial [Mycobacterium sp.]|nr:hypothetical protein [Mycobacterium sp.]
GYRWMIRCVVNGSPESVDALTEEAREALVDTVVRRDDTPLPVRTPLPVQLPEPMASQLREAAASQGAAGEESAPDIAGEEESPTPTARRSSSGSAMQQLRSTGG